MVMEKVSANVRVLGEEADKYTKTPIEPKI